MHRRRTAATRTAATCTDATPSARRGAPSTATALAGLLTGLVLAGGLTACGGAQRAWDCAKTAATVAGDIQDLQDTATNVGQISDPSRRKATVKALDKVQSDLNRLGGRGHDSDVSSAVSQLSSSVRKARTDAEHGREPDLKPVASSASHLTDVCTPG